MVILDGKKISENILEDIKKKIKENGLKLKLAVVLVGGNKPSEIFVREKKKACKDTGIEFQLFNFSSDIYEEELKKEIKKIAQNPENTGVVIQLPLPFSINTQEILNLIPEEKDVDVLSELAFEKFERGESKILSPVVCAVKRLLEEYDISLDGNPAGKPSVSYGARKIVLIGKGRLVGRPLAVWLKNIKSDFSVVDRTVKNISEFTKKADIIISGAGSPELVKKDMIKEGAVLIDAGTSSEDGKTAGDIDKSCYKKAGFIAPVPDGVGPLTVACLIDNLLNICYHQKQEE